MQLLIISDSAAVVRRRGGTKALDVCCKAPSGNALDLIGRDRNYICGTAKCMTHASENQWSILANTAVHPTTFNAPGNVFCCTCTLRGPWCHILRLANGSREILALDPWFQTVGGF